jgi:hypothetical protein
MAKSKSGSGSIVKSVESMLPKGISLMHLVLALVLGLMICSFMNDSVVEGLDGDHNAVCKQGVNKVDEKLCTTPGNVCVNPTTGVVWAGSGKSAPAANLCKTSDEQKELVAAHTRDVGQGVTQTACTAFLNTQPGKKCPDGLVSKDKTQLKVDETTGTRDICCTTYAEQQGAAAKKGYIQMGKVVSSGKICVNKGNGPPTGSCKELKGADCGNMPGCHEIDCKDVSFNDVSNSWRCWGSPTTKNEDPPVYAGRSATPWTNTEMLKVDDAATTKTIYNTDENILHKLKCTPGDTTKRANCDASPLLNNTQKDEIRSAIDRCEYGWRDNQKTIDEYQKLYNSNPIMGYNNLRKLHCRNPFFENVHIQASDPRLSFSKTYCDHQVGTKGTCPCHISKSEPLNEPQFASGLGGMANKVVNTVRRVTGQTGECINPANAPDSCLFTHAKGKISDLHGRAVETISDFVAQEYDCKDNHLSK